MLPRSSNQNQQCRRCEQDTAPKPGFQESSVFVSLGKQQLCLVLSYERPWENLSLGSKVTDQKPPIFSSLGKLSVQGLGGRGPLCGQLGQHSKSHPARFSHSRCDSYGVLGVV